MLSELESMATEAEAVAEPTTRRRREEAGMSFIC
jgi:hypothetical protein